MTQYIKRLPAVFQTVTEKKFFDATFDQVFSKKDSDLLYGYIGQRIPGYYNPVSDFYLPEPSKDRTWWQLEPTSYSKNPDSTKSNVFFYDDLLNRINYYGGNTLNQDRLFDSEYYSWAPPIDYDMFMNYHNYYWVEQGLVSIQIYGVMASDIIGKQSYTTPETANPPNLKLTSGLNIMLMDDPAYPNPMVVENIGGCTGLRLVPHYPDYTYGTILEFLPWDGTIQLNNGRLIQNTNWDTMTWDVQPQPGNGDYITIERGAVDRNAWSRTNKWFHIDAINSTIQVTKTPFPGNASRALRPIIQFSADLKLYNSGTQFKADVSYGFRDYVAGVPILLANYQGKSQTEINTELQSSIKDGNLVMFMNDTTSYSGSYVNNFVFKAEIDVVTDIVTFVPFGSAAIDGDIVFILNDAIYDGAQRGQTWYFDNNAWVIAANDKVSNNQPPLFQLYDHNGIPLDDATTYPDSTFAGNTIFAYKVDTTPGATADPVLKFPIVYTALGQSTDIVFQNSLIVDRYVYGPNRLPINGYYYYSIFNDPVHYNGWQLHEPCVCNQAENLPPPCNCITASKQRVIDKFVVGYGSEYQFKLSVTPYGYDLSTGSHRPYSDIVVSVNGQEIKNALNDPLGYFFVEINDRIYVDLQLYLTQLMSVKQDVAPVVEIATYTHDLLNPEYPGYYEIPQQLKSNPTQEEIKDISASDLIAQFTSIIESQTGFSGVAFGGTNNYRDTVKNNTLGAFILQNITPMLKTMLVSSDADLDVIAGIRFSQDEYTKFKNKYLQTAKQLIDQEFNPVQYHNNTVVISAWVDEILKVVNISKEFSKAFAYSYMVASGTTYLNESHVVPLGGNLLLTNYLDLNDPRNAFYVYDITGHERILTIGVDYEIVSTNLTIELKFIDSLEGNTVYVAFYKNPLPAYIPSTPSKVGAYNTYIPRIELDTSYTIPTNVIIGHDGSKTIAYNDYRDQLLLELETRIYNLLEFKFRNQYSPPVRLEDVKPGFFRQTRYSREEYLDITISYLNKWSAKNRANYRVNDWYLASNELPINSLELWKLYNYSTAVSPTGENLNLPGNWKGIYQYFYDTIRPNTCPWEMLGFTAQPVWWIDQYGLDWTPANLSLWEDLEAGIIRQGPTAVYDPETLQPIPNKLWARPGLSNIIPVDLSGNIKPILDVNNPSNSLFDIAYSGNMYSPFDGFDNPWVYGDGAPVEQAWMSTSAYAFSVQEFLYLMRPAAFGELLFDTLGTEYSPGTITIPGVTGPVKSNQNYQYVQNEVYASSDLLAAWMRPKNSTQIVHAEEIDNFVQVRYGYQRWISDRILFLGKNVGTTFGQKIRTLNVNLANKFAGFTNKDTANIYMEAASINEQTTSLIIPSTNFDVLLHKGQPIKTYAYSGVIIRALADGKFVVYGYDLLNSEFTIINRSNAQLIDISIGGTPAEFKTYTLGETYYPGDIVRYNGVYYSCLVTVVAGKFTIDNWQKLKSLPIVGGVSVSYKPISEETYTKVPYGSVLTGAQEVFDFLIGWGAYLESQGWQFTEVSPDTNQISDWLYSAKQFLFWLNTNWAPDSSIQLSPLANSAKLIVQQGYPDDVETLSNGVYSILDKYGVAIPTNETTTDRDGRTIIVAPASLTSGGIYFLQVNTSETEHVLIFDNVTSFSDVIYNPLLGVRQQRLRFNGFRSNNWYGKKEAPGYLIIENQLVPNYDTIVDSMRYYYDPDVTIDNPSIEALGRHLIGYESKSYLENLQVSNDVQYLFYQGAIREKGTTQSLEKLFRSTKVRTTESIQVYEEWALKAGDFGNTIEQVSTEFVLKPEVNTGEVVVARLNYVPSKIGSVKEINIVTAENVYTKVPQVIIDPPDFLPDVFTIWSPTATYNSGDIVSYANAQRNIGFFSCKVDGTIGQLPTNTDFWNLDIQTRNAKAYAVLDSTGRISRIDISDQGYGYLTAPHVELNSGKELHHLDKFYSVWQGEIVKDVSLENIVEIDIDNTDVWTVRPADPQYSLQFPTTEKIEYNLPNAGYVNFNDVDWYAFDVANVQAKWGSKFLNPVANDSVWIAKNFIEDWNVYKMVSVVNPPSTTNSWKIIRNAADNLVLLTSITTKIVPEGTVIDQTPIEITLPDSTVISVIPNVYRTDFGNAIAIQTMTQEVNVPTSNYVVMFEYNDLYVDPDTLVTYNSYLLTNAEGIPLTSDNIGDFEQITDVLTFNSMRWYTTPKEPKLPVYVGIGDYIWVDDVAGKWAVIEISADPGYWDFTLWDPVNTGTLVSPPDVLINFWAQKAYYDYGWDIRGPMYFNPIRIQEKLINSSLFESAQVYASRTNNELALLPVYDPFKGILPALAKQNITYMLLQDPASYNITGNPNLYSENITFGESQVGKLWWDLSSVRYVYYEQPAIKSSTAGVNILTITSLNKTATVTTKGPHNLKTDDVIYMSGADPEIYNGRYSVKVINETQFTYDMQYAPISDAISVGSYVIGGETATENLTYRRDHWGQIFPGSSVAVYEWTKSDVPPAEYVGSGIPRSTTDYVQLAISNRFTNTTDIKYYFWVLNPTDKPNIENRTLAAFEVAKMLESPKSQGFAFFAPIQQTESNNSYMFYNVQDMLVYRGNNVQIQYRLAERDDQKHSQWKFFREGDKNSLVSDQYWDKFVDSITGYTKLLPVSEEWSHSVLIADYMPWDIYGWDIAPFDDATTETTPVYGEVLPVPDPSLSEAEKYGIKYRPRQGMFVNLQAARKVFVQSANSLLQHIPIRDNNTSWNQFVSTSIYWDYTNWYALGFENVTPSVVFSTLVDANNALLAGKLSTGTILEVLRGTADNRYMMYNVVQLGTNSTVQSLECVCIENSAIKLLDTVYTVQNSYGMAVELRELLNAFRTQVFVNDYLIDQNELYFSMLNYVYSEQKNPDWTFKSSYVYVKENNIPLAQPKFYVPEQLNDILDYISNSKPYHTQIRDYTTVYTVSDLASGTASDYIKHKTVLAFGPDNGGPYKEAGWDTNCDYPELPGQWDAFSWDTFPENYAYILDPIKQVTWDVLAWDKDSEQMWDSYILADQFVSKEEIFTVELTDYDPAKKGFSELYPYTFNFDSINLDNPQTFITPSNLVSITVGNNVLTYGKDYFVEYNVLDNNYTAYFYNDVGTSVPVANVLWDGGKLIRFKYNTNRTEIAYGFANDNFVVNVSTKLPVNNVDSIYYPLAPWGDTTNSVDPVVASIITQHGGVATYDPAMPVTIEFLPETVSYKQNLGSSHNNLYRNSAVLSGILMNDLPAPTDTTENLDVITISCIYDVLPDPTAGFAPAIWINGERIEYKSKINIDPTTWQISLVRRGTQGTAPTYHIAHSVIWVERYNEMPEASNNTVWNAIDTAPADTSNVTSVSSGGLWYASTREAEFLKASIGLP